MAILTGLNDDKPCTAEISTVPLAWGSLPHKFAKGANEPAKAAMASSQQQQIIKTSHQSSRKAFQQSVFGNSVAMDSMSEKLEPSAIANQKAPVGSVVSIKGANDDSTRITTMNSQTMRNENESRIKQSWFDLSTDYQSRGDHQKGLHHSIDADEQELSNELAADMALTMYAPFPLKLHRALEKAAVEGMDYILSWHPDGASFRVHDSKLFVEVFMPKYFGAQSKFKSFQRQLNLYGFVRQSDGDESGYYRHPLFQRETPELCRHMKIQKIKGQKSSSDQPSPKSKRTTKRLKRTLSDSHILTAQTEQPARTRAVDTSHQRAFKGEDEQLEPLSGPNRAPKRTRSDETFSTFEGKLFYPVDDRALRDAIL